MAQTFRRSINLTIPEENRRVLARYLAAWHSSAISLYPGRHGQPHVGTPKRPGEPPRVQPSKKVAANWDDKGNPVLARD